MTVLAAEITAKGTGAISTIQIAGKGAGSILKKIFTPAGKTKDFLKPGAVSLGKITEHDEAIDEVVLGCESQEVFAIHCHGNPLIVEMILRLLVNFGCEVVSSRKLLAQTPAETADTIAIESRLCQIDAKTLEGTKILENQIHGGLSEKAGQWLDAINQKPISELKNGAESILKNSQIAKFIIHGCKVLLLGSANTGKSTLLNCLSGREKAVVADIRGTTRDWVTGSCRIGPIHLELTDTAGIDSQPGIDLEDADKAARQKTLEMIEAADLILFVLDNSYNAGQTEQEVLERIAGKKIITVLNKSDLPAKLNTEKLPAILNDTVKTSAKYETNIDKLREKILLASGATDFDLNSAVCFTARQEKLLQKLTRAKTADEAALLITELLKGELSV